jgi:ribosome biogenesis protein BRX1
MDELKLAGNCAKYSRPVLSFSAEFDLDPQWMIVREILTKIFSPAESHKKVKPFFDHVFNFSVADNHLWFRNYQISEAQSDRIAESSMNLVEMGPRFVLCPIKIFEGSFRGSVVYENPSYKSPALLRQMMHKSQGSAYSNRVEKAAIREEKMKAINLPQDLLDNVFD